LRLVEQVVAKDDPDPKALACYGLLCPECDRIWVRFVDGGPKSVITIQFLDWCSSQLEAEGKTALLLVWDNATWHLSREVKAWLRQHNRGVKEVGRGVRIITCQLPKRSPRLNPIEAHWVQGKRAVVEPDRLLPARKLAERVCDYFDCPYEAHLSIPNEVA
jgi:transposase